MNGLRFMCGLCRSLVFFFNDTATTEIYPLSLHDALPISLVPAERAQIETRVLGQQVGVNLTKPCVPATHDFTCRVDVVGRGVYAGERVQVDDPDLLLPEERPAAAQAVATRAHDLAQRVHRLRLAHRTTQRA